MEVFKAASGEAVQFEYTDPWNTKTLLQTMEAVVNDPQLTRILKSLAKAKAAKIKAVQKVLEEK